MSKVFVGKCPSCDADLFKEEGQDFARCNYCGSVIGTHHKAEAPAKRVTLEAKIEKKKPDNKLSIALISGLGVLFTGLAVMLLVLGITTARGNLRSKDNTKPDAEMGSNFLGRPDEVYTDDEVDIPESASLDGAETILDDETPLAAELPSFEFTQYGDLTENECRAVDDALFCLSMTSFSRQMLFDSLAEGKDAQYTYDEANHALDYMEENGLVDWYAQAVKAGEDLLEIYSYNRKQLIHLLTTGAQAYTQKEAEFAADTLGLE
ncbi:Ltp family lipoprotein [Butyrivibrio sp. VCD2006]|uniref:Ltp family lipoprotein n=1 Tax=Butyrivibrio sp. VCD2006 TaxID=1280664 RepID=UPI0004201614|nr:Ltp family lipoprotein [Butyrivibrio sp. VCD2006]